MVNSLEQPEAQELLDSLREAKRTVRMMAMGIMPSQAAAQAAVMALRTASQERSAEMHNTTTVLTAIRMGVAPSQSRCLSAQQHIDVLIENCGEHAQLIRSERPRSYQ